ncbi:hypothetical protein GCK72_025917 [Caenorhabditis remanei]|uniref:Uncharacterized protein n=1 Tax=Caenorhabditis remanei TaxID=31234 RepID=A0A6A5G4N3_CAERE|nr:hypothetical protein GCK72_025917 [Caenorhabditis remanei]KAF1749449.1 hypothetical protein GCK72_025917 [Caenorhabditis remanei]
MKLFALVSFLLIRNSLQSECIVSEWGTWSKCHGGCKRGLIVRNRDVLQPPLQELTEEGRMMQRLCPHLYETKYCDKTECGEEEKKVNYEQLSSPPPLPVETTTGQIGRDAIARTTESARNLVERQMKKIGFARDTDDRTQAAIKQKFISETEQLFKLDDAINRKYGPQPSDNLVNTHSPIIDISTQQMTNKQWRDDMANKWTSVSSTPLPSYREHLQSFGRAGGIPTFTTTTSEYIPYRNSRRGRTSSDHSVSTLLRKIEQALDTNQPLDEKYVKSALRRNRKLSKILVDAYRQRQSLMNSGVLSSSSATLPTVISPYPPRVPTTEEVPAFVTAKHTTTRRYPTTTTATSPPPTTSRPSTTTTSTTVKAEAEDFPESADSFATTPDFFEAHPTTTSPLLYWPKTGGYVPNTRKHASEITAQLYMTNEIVQTLNDDPIPLDVNPECEHNKRCCKIIKNTCSHGIDPKFVKRWYRPKGSSVCVPYHYPRCSSMEEMEELPILFEQNCQDLCFSQQEKRITPLFTLESEDE